MKKEVLKTVSKMIAKNSAEAVTTVTEKQTKNRCERTEQGIHKILEKTKEIYISHKN